MQARQQIPQEYSSHSNFSEGWQVGGNTFTAVAVAKKTGTDSWVVYNIFRDHLGTITHLKNGSTIDEYSFDACDVKLRFCKPCETKPLAEHIPKSVAVREGRRRDKDNWSYTLSGEPALFADRGFTGTRSVSSGFGELCEAKTDERTNPAECSESGKFLSDFNLYNMPARLSHFHLNYFSDGQAGGNGRLYDPVLGRFLSPDPYIADPAFTQSYNRYSYVLNNPLKYNDPTGELPLWALWGIASAGNWLFGGLDNWLNKGMSFKQSFSTVNNPVTFSANYHPGSNSWSNPQVNAHRLVGSMANAERGVHSYVAGFSGMGRYGEGPLFTTTPFGSFVGESPLAGRVANSINGVFSPVSLKENVYVNVLTGFKYLWHYQQGTLPSHEMERWQSKTLKMNDIFDFSTAENWKRGGFMGGSDVIFGNIQGVEIMLQNTTFKGNLQLDPVRNNMLSIYQSEPYVGLRRVAYIRFYQEHHNYYINARRFIYSKW